MLMQYFTCDSEKYLADRYIIEHLGGCVHLATQDASHFERLSSGDELVIASVKSLTRNPTHLLLVLTELTHRGVRVHFAKEACAFHGKSLTATHETLEQVLTLLMGYAFYAQGQKGRSGLFDWDGQRRGTALTARHFDEIKLSKKISDNQREHRHIKHCALAQQQRR